MTGTKKNTKSAARTLKAAKARQAPALRHAVHLEQNKRLNRVVGQIQAIQRMITEEKYCNDILIQLRAASAALRSVELNVLKTHMRHCVNHAVNSGDIKVTETKIEEVIALLERY